MTLPVSSDTLLTGSVSFLSKAIVEMIGVECGGCVEELKQVPRSEHRSVMHLVKLDCTLHASHPQLKV